jgi:hypothetical protein
MRGMVVAFQHRLYHPDIRAWPQLFELVSNRYR